jgi:hypothetical protein
MPNFTIGDIVTVRGYGGHAEVINMEVDGVTPQGHPKYLCTVRFGPYEDNETLRRIDLPYGTVGTKSKTNPRPRRERQHQFYAGRLTNIFEDMEETIDNNETPTTQQKSSKRAAKETSQEVQEARKKKITEIEIEMKLLQAEMDEA